MYERNAAHAGKAASRRNALAPGAGRTYGRRVVVRNCVSIATQIDATGAYIVSIRHPHLDSRMVYAKLRDSGVQAAPRQGWVRLSPHFYISPAEIERMLDALPQA